MYLFRYNEQQLAVRTDPHHCFDGILVSNGTMLIDTYWTSGGRRFTLKEAQAQGTIEFLCNLEEMKEIREADVQYFDDVITLFIHAGHRKKFLIKKEQPRSQTKMLENIKDKIAEKIRVISMAQDNIERLELVKAKVESGDLNVFF
jgi:hypothetical protein